MFFVFVGQDMIHTLFFFLDFLTSMMIKIWNYISATLRIWEAICWMAEGGSKKRCYCRSRKRARSAAKRFARGAPFVRFNTTTWQSTFDPIVKLLKFIVILSMKVFCIQTWWAGPLFDWDRWWGGKIKLKLQIPTLPPTTMNTWWIILSCMWFALTWKHCPGVHGDNKVCLRVPDAVPGTHHSCQQCQVQSFCAGESNISTDKMRMRPTVSSSFTPNEWKANVICIQI